MPIQPCQENGRPGFKFGESGTCYTYPKGDKIARQQALEKAEKQRQAIEANKGT